MAFGAGNVAQYYVCDLSADGTTASNRAAASQGSYAVGAVNGAPILSFTGQPATAQVFDVVYTQIRWNAADPTSQWVYRAHAIKPDFNSRLTSSDRLNATAWAAMKTKLGL